MGGPGIYPPLFATPSGDSCIIFIDLHITGAVAAITTQKDLSRSGKLADLKLKD